MGKITLRIDYDVRVTAARSRNVGICEVSVNQTLPFHPQNTMKRQKSQQNFVFQVMLNHFLAQQNAPSAVAAPHYYLPPTFRKPLTSLLNVFDK